MAKQDHRSDFVRRLFAIAVSVGFAGAIAGSAWVRERRLPLFEELELLTLLFAGLALLIGSWERYHQSVKTDLSIWVFFLDVAIVLSYLLILLLSAVPVLFLMALCLVYGLYCTWWLVVLWEDLHPVSEARFRLLATALWLAFFAGTAWRWYVDPASTWMLGIMATIAIVLYRWKLTRRPLGTLISIAILSAVQLLI